MIKTYTEILSEIADSFDAYINPKKIRRSDTNFVYLVLKAVAKGYEVINNTVERLANKFDPERCEDVDLYSTAKLVGTSFLSGKGSGLVLVCKNTGGVDNILAAGDYYYAYDANTRFEFSVSVDTTFTPNEERQYIAVSDVVGKFPVSAMLNVPIVRVDSAEVNPEFVFSCSSNEELQGRLPETALEFRNRILSDTTRQDAIVELETELKNLPYILDCKLVFNQGMDDVVVDGVTIPGFHLLVILLGDARDEIADVIAERIIYPTVNVIPTDVVYSYAPNYIGGKYPVYWKPFGSSNYSVEITYRYDATIISNSNIVTAIDAAFSDFRNPSKYVKTITENLFYEKINGLSLPSLEVLDVKIIVDAAEVPYINVPATRLGKLVSTTYTPEV